MRFWSQIKPLFIPDGWDKVKLLQDGMAIDGFNLYSCLSTNPSTTQKEKQIDFLLLVPISIFDQLLIYWYEINPLLSLFQMSYRDPGYSKK